MYRIDEPKRAEQEAHLKALHEKLTTAVGNLVTGEDWMRALMVSARLRAYSAMNSVLIWVGLAEQYAQGLVPTDTPTMVAGIKQWNSLGRTVIKGQHGLEIRLPVFGRYAAEHPDAPEATWRRLGSWEKLAPGEVLKRKLVNTKVGRVFDVCQTEGAPVEPLPSPVLLTGQAPSGLWDGVAAQIAARGFDLRLVDSAKAIGGANGLTNYLAKTVQVRTDVEPLSAVRTLTHELAHVLAHGPDAEDAATHRGIAEVEAESTAALVLGAHGVDTSQYTVPYVATWASSVPGDQVETVMRTFDRVAKTATTILSLLDTTQVGNGLPPGLDREAHAHQHAPDRGGPTPRRAVGRTREAVAR
ncbi:serine/arginine repetitive matrix protein 2 [Xylanimonas allomyrinae]|uniref:Serine/arginine repetitive matrix protein 2 n=1 Tax=Xylanimonas allomyrinae TaxID=2509459 RepID=A0A4P6ELA5_9MICO|nr:ArdC-like ssDNA-binding domain-containing protein [Xylanimonas allomyrinae]QAY63550.1 serine/arginine repetitive matrix protein 2 [Xylanimonas allomyrinae]